jgi:LPXTG-motif cell wall-anchored protein
MAFDENPDEVFENEPEPEAEMEGNSDEQSNRSFRMMMIGLFAFGALGVLLIALILIGRQGERSTIDAQNQAVQATNAAVAALALVSPTPLPTDTPMPTNTAAPANTPAPAATPVPKDLVDTALAAGDFKTLASLLETAGLVEALKGQGPFTVFAPTDDAFAQLSPESLEALKKDPAKLEALLKYHVVQGAIKAADVAKLSTAETLQGQPVVIVVKDDTTQINESTVTKPDQETANGVIHTIDRVLVPPDLRKEVVVIVPPTPKPGATQVAAGQATPAPAGKGTAIAQVQGTTAANATAKPATGAQATAAVATRVPPQAATATAAASKNATGTKPITGTTGTGSSTGLPTTGASDNLVMLLLAAVGLVGILVVARRLRTSQG